MQAVNRVAEIRTTIIVRWRDVAYMWASFLRKGSGGGVKTESEPSAENDVINTD